MSSLNKIQSLLISNQIDCAIVNSPENFFYLSGLSSHQHTVTRQPYLACAVIAGQVEFRPQLIVMDFEKKRFDHIHEFDVIAYDTWVGVRTIQQLLSTENAEIAKKVKPVQKCSIYDQIEACLAPYLSTVRVIGLEMDFLSVNVFEKIKALFPQVEFKNISPLFIDARSVKNADEIAIFRKMITVQDEALAKTLPKIKTGVTELDISQFYRDEVSKSEFVPSSWSMFSAGKFASFLGLPTDNRIQDGDIFKYDGGVNAETHFYTTDFARSWIIGRVDPALLALKQTLYQAQRLMISQMRPGVVIGDIFKLGFEAVKAIYPCYERGHLGHSISLGPSTWEAPLIAATEQRRLEENMILCVEVPLYIENIGGFNIEDMVLITKDGCEILSHITPHFTINELASSSVLD